MRLLRFLAATVAGLEGALNNQATLVSQLTAECQSLTQRLEANNRKHKYIFSYSIGSQLADAFYLAALVTTPLLILMCRHDTVMQYKKRILILRNYRIVVCDKCIK